MRRHACCWYSGPPVVHIIVLLHSWCLILSLDTEPGSNHMGRDARINIRRNTNTHTTNEIKSDYCMLLCIFHANSIHLRIYNIQQTNICVFQPYITIEYYLNV